MQLAEIFEPIYTTSGAARRCDVSEDTIRRAADAGTLPVTRTVTGARLFRESDLDRYRSRRQMAETLR
jgi:excisionase family DNA binding protein